MLLIKKTQIWGLSSEMPYRELICSIQAGQPVRANPEANFYSKNSKQSWKTSSALGSVRGQETDSLAWLAYRYYRK